MKLGIIGSGMITQEFLQIASTIEGLEVVAICATPASEVKLQTLCKEHRIPQYYMDAQKIINDDEVDTIYVATPNHLHYSFCKQAMLARKHVICEKPFTTNSSEAKELVNLAEKQQVILIEAVTTHYLPNMLKIKELLSLLGNVKIVSANFSQYSSRYDAFKQGSILPAFNPAMSGGALMDLNIYNINFVVALFGKPSRVLYTANVERGIDTSGILTLDYKKFQCVCIGAKDCKAPISTTIQGDKGYITMNSPVSIIENFTLVLNNEAKEEIYNYNANQHRMYHEFIEFVRIIDAKDFTFARKMLEISAITMEIQTEARKQAGVIFPADT